MPADKAQLTDTDLQAPLDVLLDTNAICEILGCSRMTLHRRRQEPDFPEPIMLGGRPHWWRSEHRAYLERRRERKAPPIPETLSLLLPATEIEGAMV